MKGNIKMGWCKRIEGETKLGRKRKEEETKLGWIKRIKGEIKPGRIERIEGETKLEQVNRGSVNNVKIK